MRSLCGREGDLRWSMKVLRSRGFTPHFASSAAFRYRTTALVGPGLQGSASAGVHYVRKTHLNLEYPSRKKHTIRNMIPRMVFFCFLFFAFLPTDLCFMGVSKQIPVKTRDKF